QKVALVEKARADVGMAEAAEKSAAAKVDQARAEITRAQFDVAYRKVESERYQRMVKDHTASADQAAERENQFRAAQAASTTADSSLRVEQAKELQAKADVVGAKARLTVAEADR